MSKQYEIKIIAKIMYTGDDFPNDALVITPIKNAIKDKLKPFKATHELDMISDKVEVMEMEEEEANGV